MREYHTTWVDKAYFRIKQNEEKKIDSTVKLFRAKKFDCKKKKEKRK